eukprot:CAMPEP_0183454168 /NCGR_PEP_ID=MMETSP0370-20130417/123225_1 /TAXON_ID=268820 /ORGANISM="Peridinium aciculiferum, Strain PAER-2" /LENGTH=51 /DNA_ID=CAMNT_0025645651 /DNA_START=37 /DNA_END=189 /DNA_ORIENTATION=+
MAARWAPCLQPRCARDAMVASRGEAAGQSSRPHLACWSTSSTTTTTKTSTS